MRPRKVFITVVITEPPTSVTVLTTEEPALTIEEPALDAASWTLAEPSLR